MNFPSTKREEVIEEIHGHKIDDPYRWLEDANNPEVQDWINAQNEYVDESLRKDARFDAFSGELIQNFNIVGFSSPVMRHGRYFYSERQPGEDQHVIYFKDGLTGTPTPLINPNGMNASNTVSIDFWIPSKSGKYLAYGLSEGGTEMATLYVMDVETQTNLSDQIPHCRHSQVRWLPDDSGFFYTRNPLPGTVPKNEEHLHTKIHFHMLGENSDTDEMIFGSGRPKDDMIGISLSLDGRYLCVHAAQTWQENELYMYDRRTKTTTPLVVGVPAKFNLGFLQDRAYITTNLKANNRRVLWTPLDALFTPVDEWKELIPEREYPLVKVMPTKSKLLVEYSVDVCSRVFILDHDGKRLGEIPLPQYSTLVDVSTHRDEEEFFYGVQSFTFPKIAYHYNPEKNAFEVFRKMPNPINPDEYVIKQEWYVSKDGTRVPLFIFHRKDIPVGPNPLILRGYGGFGNSEEPYFGRGWVPWYERGGVFAIANIRGGGEFGKKWHEQGIKEHKQNSFDDFITAAEYLIEKGYTDSQHLGVIGASNGGLLVSAVEVQRPDLFRAVCSGVPLTDMVRFPLFGIASRWVHEYGDPNTKEGLGNILTWSPYHTVKAGTEYPATLFTTAEQDSRVNPLHARKMAALLQSVNTKNDIFLFTEKEAGHGSGRPIKKMIETQALTLTFFASKLGLK